MPDPSADLIQGIRESFERLQTMASDLHLTDEDGPAANAAIIADLKRELESMRGGLEAAKTYSALRWRLAPRPPALPGQGGPTRWFRSPR
jgi:hypothetical protein